MMEAMSDEPGRTFNVWDNDACLPSNQLNTSTNKCHYLEEAWDTCNEVDNCIGPAFQIYTSPCQAEPCDYNSCLYNCSPPVDPCISICDQQPRKRSGSKVARTTTYTKDLGSNKVLVVKKREVTEYDSTKTYCKAGVFIMVFIVLTSIVYVFANNFSKAREVLCLAFLLLLTLHVFEPDHFVPSMVMASARNAQCQPRPVFCPVERQRCSWLRRCGQTCD